MKRKFPRLAIAALAIALTSIAAHAQDYPSKAITIVAPFAAGGSADGVARLVANELSRQLGQTVIVDNRPGGGGSTGLLMVARAKPDGYTLGIGATGAIAIEPHLPDAPPLNPEKQLQPLAKLADIPLIIVASQKSGFTSLQGLIDKAKTTDVPVGNSGQYTAHHLSGELLASTAKIRLSAVPYKGSAPAVADVLGGQIPVAIVDLTSVAGQLKAGTVKALAVTGATRSRLAPEVPTVAEAGVPGYEAPAWMGLFAPKGLPAAVSERLAKELQVMLEKQEVQKQFLALSSEPSYLDSERFTAFIQTESQRWAKAVSMSPQVKQTR